jgi:hypothetical protein
VSDTRTEPYPANLFAADTRESRGAIVIAILATLLVHVAVVLVLPAELMPINDVGAKDDAANEIYEISLVENPVEPRFVEASLEAPENEPDRTDQYSFRAQQAADESPLEDALNQPKVEGEEDSQKILQGALEQVPPVEPGIYSPAARLGAGEGDQGGELGQPSEVAMLMPSQPLPAPAFIQQDPVAEAGPGSRRDLVGEAQQVLDTPDPDAPINVYRSQPVAEPTQPVGNGAGGVPDAQPAPRARPRLAPELITGPLMRSQGSASRRGSLAIDATFSEFGEYQQQFYAAIQTGWYQEIEFFQPIDTSTRVQVRFTIYSDGRVEGVKTVQTTASEIATFICETAIIKRTPFRPWTKEMVQVFGQQRTLDVFFHYR